MDEKWYEEHRSWYWSERCILCQERVPTEKPHEYRLWIKAPKWWKVIDDEIFKYNPGSRMASVAFSQDGSNRVWNEEYKAYPVIESNFKFGGNLLHKSCIERVQGGPSASFALLLDIVEKTFFAPDRTNFDRVWRSSSRGIKASVENGVSGDRISGDANIALSALINRLPIELWHMIEHFGVGRLLFVMKLASQIKPIPQITPVDRRQPFDVRTVCLKGDYMRISIINLGGRSYVADISDPRDSTAQSDFSDRGLLLSHFEVTQLDILLVGRNYLAIKSDGTGVVDIGTRRLQSGPEWLLGNDTRLFPEAVSEARDVNIRQLRLITDAVKCRAVVSQSRKGAEPFFEGLMPPGDAWIDSSFPNHSNLTTFVPMDWMAHCTKAVYFPFSAMSGQTVTWTVTPIFGFEGFNVWLPNVDPFVRCAVGVQFDKPPNRVKILICSHAHGEAAFPQFYINHQWLPSLSSSYYPHGYRVEREILVENALGLWWGQTYTYTPINLGVVVSRVEDLRNTEVCIVG